MAITLINPPEQKRVWCGIPKTAAAGVYCFPPLGLMYLQASLEKFTPMTAEIFDPTTEDLDYPDVEMRLRKHDLDLVAISTYTHALADVQMMVNLTKKQNPNAFVVLGGPHCSMFPEYAIQMEGVDAIILGDGEDTFVELSEARNSGRSLEGIDGLWFKAGGQIIKNMPRATQKNLSHYPWPDRRRVDWKKYYVPGSVELYTTTAVTSRGCPHSCPFCLADKGTYRLRGFDDIIDEMEHCLEVGIKELMFVDDMFSPNSNWSEDFAQAILRRGVKMKWGFKTTIAGTTKEMIRAVSEAGCRKIHFGVETANNEGLEGYKKHCNTDDVRQVFDWCREYNVKSVAYLMIAGPHERTRADVLRNVDHAIELDPDYSVVAIFSPYPGTPSFTEGVKKGLFPADVWEKMMTDPLSGVEVPICWEEHLKKDEILDLLKECQRRFYFRPKFVLRNGIPHSYGEFKRLAGGFMSLVKTEMLTTRTPGSPV